MTTTPTYLVPKDAASAVLGSVVDDLFNAYNTAFASANTVIVQPGFSNDLLATLPEDQALVAAHATTFIRGWGFGVAGSFLSSLSSVATFVTQLLETGLLPAAKILDRASPDSSQFQTSLASLRAYLGVISATCCKLDPDSRSILLGMQSMNTKLQGLFAQIRDDCTKLDTAVAEVARAGTVQKLLSQQKDLQAQFADVNSQLAKGATTTIASDIEFGFSFATEFLDGVNPSAVAGSALAVVGEVDAIQAFNEQNKALLSQQAQLGSQIVALVDAIGQDQQDQLELTLVAAQVDILTKQLQDLLDDTGSVLAQLTGWSDQLALLSELSAPPTLGFYQAQVTSGQAFWSGLYDKLTRYQGILALSSR
jgi:hypothetical protein